jgi:hypothetical protein
MYIIYVNMHLCGIHTVRSHCFVLFLYVGVNVTIALLCQQRENQKVLVGHVQEKDMNGVVQVVLFASYAVQAAGVGRYTSHKQQ